jgi:hypothetical protein
MAASRRRRLPMAASAGSIAAVRGSVRYPTDAGGRARYRSTMSVSLKRWAPLWGENVQLG